MGISKEESNKKISVALTSVIAALVLTGAKLIVGIWTNSLGILAEALHSALDMVAAIITFIAVYLSRNPADSEHHFGHGKIENFSALIETLILLITCVWIIWEALNRFIEPVTPEVNIFSFGVIIFAIIVDYERSRMLFRVAKQTRSQALEADALHFSTDILSSSVVILGLIFVFIGFPIGDAVAALVVAVIVIWISLRLGRETINALMDKAPKEETEIIKNFIKNNYPSFEIKKFRLRESGPHIVGDLTLFLPPDTLIDDFHYVSESIHTELNKLIPTLDLMINASPKNVDEPKINMATLSDEINSIVLPGNIQYKTHGITYYKYGGLKIIYLSLELPENLSLKESSYLYHIFEKEIINRIPHINKVFIKLEPLI